MTLRHLYIFAIVLFILGLVSLSSCYYDNEQYLYGAGACDTTASVSYTGRIKSIMDTRCATSACHGGSSPANGLDLTTYDGVKIGVEAIGMLCNIKQESGCSPMPKNEGRIANCDILAIEKWKATGYPENN